MSCDAQTSWSLSVSACVHVLVLCPRRCKSLRRKTMHLAQPRPRPLWHRHPVSRPMYNVLTPPPFPLDLLKGHLLRVYDHYSIPWNPTHRAALSLAEILPHPGHAFPVLQDRHAQWTEGSNVITPSSALCPSLPVIYTDSVSSVYRRDIKMISL